MRRHLPLLGAVLAGTALVWFGTTLKATESAVPPARSPLPPTGRDWSLRQTPVVEVVRRVQDAIVNIHSERTARGPAAEELFATAPSQNRINGMGTGILIDPHGYILTNQHVVEDVRVIRARLHDGTTLSARVLARDHEADLALLKVDANRPLPVVPLGTSSDLMVGETVVAIGNAYGYEHTVTVGVISAIGRDVTLNREVSYKALIQTDAAINPGNSGGPLLNIKGELIGVNVAIRAGAQGIGFAIPVDTVIRVAAGMLSGQGEDGGVSAGLTVKDELQPQFVARALGTAPEAEGVRAAHKTSKMGMPAAPPAVLEGEQGPLRAVVVDSLEQGGPASRAGIHPGDVLVRVGGRAVESSLDLPRSLLDARPGERVPVVLRRPPTPGTASPDWAERRVEVVVQAARRRAPETGDNLVWDRLGVRLHGMTPDALARENQALPPGLHGGLAIDEVRPHSLADRAGIRSGDVLIGLHQWEMLTPENVVFVLNHPDLASFQPLRFYILRSGQVHRGWLQPVE